mgnify:CR=1 FL=1
MILLYHTKQQLGTTTNIPTSAIAVLLYHTKQQLGTTTIKTKYWKAYNYIIPNNNWELQRLSGSQVDRFYYIIPNNNWELQR